MSDSYDIAVYQGTTEPPEIASGVLTVDTSTNPITGTFTPTGGTQVTVHISNWSSSPNGAVNWSFQVSGSANGDFPLGPNGTPFTYVFTGVENANGTNPSGGATWPKSQLEDTGAESTTWQAEATEGDPVSRGTAAS